MRIVQCQCAEGRMQKGRNRQQTIHRFVNLSIKSKPHGDEQKRHDTDSDDRGFQLDPDSCLNYQVFVVRRVIDRGEGVVKVVRMQSIWAARQPYLPFCSVPLLIHQMTNVARVTHITPATD